MVIGTPRKLLTTALFLFANSAWAGASFYADAGASGVEIHTPAPFWGFGVPSASLGYGLNYGIWTTFSTNEPVINLQFGIQDRYESATGNGASYGYMAAYPELRLQISRLYFTAGYTPFVMKSLDYNGTSTGLSRVSDATAYLGEAGILFPITPKVSFGLSASVEYVHENSVASPNPIAAGNAFLRFYFGFGDGSHGSSEFHGWRYPFGRN
jgi:hypothetical protein